MIDLTKVAETMGVLPHELFIFIRDGREFPALRVSGWLRVLASQQDFLGCEFTYSESRIGLVNNVGQTVQCPEWIEATIHRKDKIGFPVREYALENYHDLNDAWSRSPSRQLRYKAQVQATKLAYGFGGVYDEDDVSGVSEQPEVDQHDSCVSAPTKAHSFGPKPGLTPSDGTDVDLPQKAEKPEPQNGNEPSSADDTDLDTEQYKPSKSLMQTVTNVITKAKTGKRWEAAADWLKAHYEGDELQWAMSELDTVASVSA